jgi:hypothetical protein
LLIDACYTKLNPGLVFALAGRITTIIILALVGRLDVTGTGTAISINQVPIVTFRIYYETVPTNLDAVTTCERIMRSAYAGSPIKLEVLGLVAGDASTYVVDQRHWGTAHYCRAVQSDDPALKTVAPSKLRKEVKLYRVTGHTVVRYRV